MRAFDINCIIGRWPFLICVTFNMAVIDNNINLIKLKNMNNVLISNFTLSQLAIWVN